ncbi:MAG TPA: lipocalin family protein [Yeosuana sp.]
MKKPLFILLAFMILGCNQNLKKNGLLIGTWDLVSETDIETGEVRFPESDDLEFVEFKSDSMYTSISSNPYKGSAWQIEGDSIFFNDADAVYIKEMTDNELTVEYDNEGIRQLNFKKRK